MTSQNRHTGGVCENVDGRDAAIALPLVLNYRRGHKSDLKKPILDLQLRLGGDYWLPILG